MRPIGTSRLACNVGAQIGLLVGFQMLSLGVRIGVAAAMPDFGLVNSLRS